MIKIKFKNDMDWQVVKPTIFPDKTSQVWKIDLEEPPYHVIVKWNFESEDEIIHVLQLTDLLCKYGAKFIELQIPYFPYARQDKEITNKTTFARQTFLNLLTGNRFDKIITYDIHSELPRYLEIPIEGTRKVNLVEIINRKPEHFISTIQDFKPDAIFFPDEGAFNRYNDDFSDCKEWTMTSKMYGEKVRDQSTGTIISYNIVTHKDFLHGERILIVDDICDGGDTFVSAAKELKKLGVEDIGLCVSHGVFSKGLGEMLFNGITKFYTTDSFIRSKVDTTDDRILTVYPAV